MRVHPVINYLFWCFLPFSNIFAKSNDYTLNLSYHWADHENSFSNFFCSNLCIFHSSAIFDQTVPVQPFLFRHWSSESLPCNSSRSILTGAGRTATAASRASLIAAAVQAPVDVEVLHKPGLLLIGFSLAQAIFPDDGGEIFNGDISKQLAAGGVEVIGALAVERFAYNLYCRSAGIGYIHGVLSQGSLAAGRGSLLGAGVLLPLWDWAEDWLLVEAGAELWEELCCAEL